MICILSRPTLSITVTETVVKSQGSLWWETEKIEVKSRCHRGQTVLLAAHSTSTKRPIFTTQLSLTLEQVLHFHSR